MYERARTAPTRAQRNARGCRTQPTVTHRSSCPGSSRILRARNSPVSSLRRDAKQSTSRGLGRNTFIGTDNVTPASLPRTRRVTARRPRCKSNLPSVSSSSSSSSSFYLEYVISETDGDQERKRGREGSGLPTSQSL